jgi:hypothetical protein
LRTVQTDHVMLFQVIEARNMEGVRATVRKHIESTRKRVFKGLGADEWDARARASCAARAMFSVMDPIRTAILAPITDRLGAAAEGARLNDELVAGGLIKAEDPEGWSD